MECMNVLAVSFLMAVYLGGAEGAYNAPSIISESRFERLRVAISWPARFGGLLGKAAALDAAEDKVSSRLVDGWEIIPPDSDYPPGCGIINTTASGIKWSIPCVDKVR